MKYHPHILRYVKRRQGSFHFKNSPEEVLDILKGAVGVRCRYEPIMKINWSDFSDITGAPYRDFFILHNEGWQHTSSEFQKVFLDIVQPLTKSLEDYL